MMAIEVTCSEEMKDELATVNGLTHPYCFDCSSVAAIKNRIDDITNAIESLIEVREYLNRRLDQRPLRG